MDTEKADTVADYGIPKHTLDWDVPLNADLSDIDARLTTLSSRTVGRTYYYLVAASDQSTEVKAKADYVCTGVGDQVQIQSAVNAAFADGGGIVQLTDGIFSTSAPITLHPLVTLQGAHGDQIFNPTQLTAQSFIRPDALFVGGAAIVMLGQTAGGYAGKSAEQRIFHLTIIGDLSPAGIHGIQASDYVHGAVLRDVAVVRTTGKGIYTFTENGAQPFSWTFHRVLADNAGDVGIHLINHTDCTMVDVISIGSNTHGFQLSNMPNSRMIGCRAEWSEAHGYKIEGNFGTGAGSGGMQFSGCSTDRNGQNGFDITSTGNAPLLFGDIIVRRDGRNGGAGGGDYSGFRAAGVTNPVIVDNLACYPGVDDNGAGTNSPVNAFKVSGGTYTSINSGFLHGATNGYVDGGTNAVLRRGPNIGERTGTTAAPVDAFANPWGTAGNATIAGYTALDAGQSNGAWNIFDGTKAALNLGSAGGGITIKGGTNARLGVSTLVTGTVVVTNASVAANTRIILSRETTGGTVGHLSSTRINGTSFTINSSSATDTSTVAWTLIESS